MLLKKKQIIILTETFMILNSNAFLMHLSISSNLERHLFWHILYAEWHQSHVELAAITPLTTIKKVKIKV